MSEHLWAEENLTAHAMGGLEGAERERLQAHVAECADCARELEATRNADRGLVELFMSTRPSPALEDRMIQTLRQEPLRIRWFAMPRSFKIAIAAAAVVMLAVTGAGLTSWMESGGLRLPWAEEGRTQALNNLKQMGAAAHGANDVYNRLPPGYGWRFGAVDGKVNINTWFDSESNTPVEIQDADGMARSLRDEAEKKLGLVEEKKARESAGRGAEVEGLDRGTITWGAKQPTFKEASPWVVLGDGTDSKRKAGKGATPAVPTAGLPAVAGTPPPPPDVSGGEYARKPEGGAAEAKPTDKDTKRGFQAGQSDPYSNQPAKPGGGVNGTVVAKPNGESKPTFERIDKRPNFYFKPAEAFGKATQPKAPVSADDAGLKLQDGEKERRTLNETLGEKVKEEQKADPQAEPQSGKTVAADPKPTGRKIIRSGDIEFEIDSFDAAVSMIVRLVNSTKGGFIATINSDKLPNGKVRGSVNVRVPPEELDNLVLGLRADLSKAGELKSQRIGSQDVTKQYTDMESRLKAARTMEERLLKMIAEGKGQLKDIFQVEKELGTWRTKIEELEGELRYYSNLVSLSTLNVILTEKEIRTAAVVKESERVNAGIEVEDVDKALREAIQAITEQKGRITRSELKQHSAGQFNALLHFETAPEVAGMVRDRLKQLGNMVRLEIDRVQQAVGGTVPKDGKITKGDTQFFVSLYNLANVAPRETVVHRIAAGSVPESYQKLREAIGKAKGRVVNAQLNEQDPTNIHALVEFDIRRTDEAAILLAIKDSGESITRQVSRVPEGENVTDAKILFRIELVNAANIPPRETVTLKLAAADVPAAYQAMRTVLTKVNGKVTNAQLNEQDRQNISANLDFSIGRVDESTLQETFAKASEVISRHVARQPESAQVTDARVQYRVEVFAASRIPPRETHQIAMVVADVYKTIVAFKIKVVEVKGRIWPVETGREPSGRVTARATFDVPYAEAEKIADAFKRAGEVRVDRVQPDPQAPEGNLAIARIHVTLTDQLLVPQDEGLWAQIRHGLSVSMRGLLLSVNFLVVGLLFVLPWVLVLYVVVVFVKRWWRPTPASSAPR